MMEVAILVSDCSRRGVQAAGRIAKLMKELNFKPQKTGLIVNRVPDGKLDAGTLEEIRNQGLELLGLYHMMIRYISMTVMESRSYGFRKILL